MKIDLKALKEKIMGMIPFRKKEEVEEILEEEVVEEKAEEAEVAKAEGEVEAEAEAEEELDEEAEELDEEEAAKKKKSLYIKAAVGIVVAFFILDEFTKDEKTKAPAPTKKMKSKKAQKKKSKKPKKAPTKKIAEKEVAKPAVQPPKKVEAPKKEVKREISSVPPVPPPEPKKKEVLVIEEPKKTEIIVKEKPKKAEELALDVSDIVGEIGTPTEEELKGPAPFVAAPDYNEVGRGLIYNCKGKHWACVDKNSYFACRDNLKWTKENNKGPECFTKDVYRNEKDCRIIQTHFINSNEDTEFCK